MLEDIKIIHLKSNAQQLETWIAMLNGEIVGHIYMEREENERVKFLDAWVHEEHRLKGVFRKLCGFWGSFWERCRGACLGFGRFWEGSQKTGFGGPRGWFSELGRGFVVCGDPARPQIL